MRSLIKPQIESRKLAFLIVAAWTILNAWLSASRSLWMDELSRIEHVELGSLWLAIKGVLSEPSPFTPGEVAFLYGAKKIFSSFFPLELWLRSFALVQGAIVIWFTLRSKTPYLWFFTLFSASLTSHSTQARPYSALFLAGTFLYLSLVEKTSLSRTEVWILRVQTFFTHVYGLLFLAVAHFFRRDRWWFAATIAYGLAFSWVYMRLHGGQFSDWTSNLFLPPAGEFFRQVFGVLGNPHKASYVFLPLFAVGLFRLWRTDRNLLPRILLYFVLTVGAPIAALAVGKYAFFPRQIIAATTGFLAISGIGLFFAWDWFKRRFPPAAVAVLLLSLWFAGARPWIRATLFKMPPFPDVAFHTYRDVIKSLGSEDRGRNVLIIDGAGTYHFYLKRIYGAAVSTEHHIPFRSMNLRKDCWPDFCVFTYYDSNLTWVSEFDQPPDEVKELINAPEFKFSKVIGPWVNYRPVDSTIKMRRDW